VTLGGTSRQRTSAIHLGDRVVIGRGCAHCDINIGDDVKVGPAL
jgi:serine acetyltransferase